MSFNDNVTLDTSQVRTGGGGGGGPGGMVVGGGIGGIVMLDPRPHLRDVQRRRRLPGGTSALRPRPGRRRRGDQDANGVRGVQDRRRREPEHRVPRHRHGELRAGLLGGRAAPLRQGVAADPDGALQRRHPVGLRHGEQPGRAVLLPARQDRSTSTPSFFKILEDQFGSSAGPLAQEYVVAHEYGHALQDQLGLLGRAQQDPQGPESGGRAHRAHGRLPRRACGPSTPPR